ncbi:MAG: hypothetical protein E3J91_00785 [Hadesarchaea archaeon]|nr:MAG: hypothetical protein E3J91_00785 [Hadesarchaea archaeon]
MVDKTKHFISPDLNSLVVTSRYKIPIKNWDKIIKEIEKALPRWIYLSKRKGVADFFDFQLKLWEYQQLLKLKSKDPKKAFEKKIKLYNRILIEKRRGVPFKFRVLPEQHLSDGIIVKVECIPVMYYLITKEIKREFHEQSVQEAHIECVSLVRRIMKGVLKSQEITSPTVDPFIKRTEINADKLGKLRSEIASVVTKLDVNYEKNLSEAINEYEKGHYLASALITGRVIIYILAQVEGKTDEEKIKFLQDNKIIKRDRKDVKEFIIKASKKARHFLAHDINIFADPSDALGMLGDSVKLLGIFAKLKG